MGALRYGYRFISVLWTLLLIVSVHFYRYLPVYPAYEINWLSPRRVTWFTLLSFFVYRYWRHDNGMFMPALVVLPILIPSFRYPICAPSIVRWRVTLVCSLL
jgi:hypothetical protein